MDNAQKLYVSGYKRLESFLRRLSYKIGNSPSQTEVKIISCIPIDVTELQEKIAVLERQLLKQTHIKKSKNSSTTDYSYYQIINNRGDKNKILYRRLSAIGSNEALFADRENTSSTVSFDSQKTSRAAAGYINDSNALQPSVIERYNAIQETQKNIEHQISTGAHSIRYNKNIVIKKDSKMQVDKEVSNVMDDMQNKVENPDYIRQLLQRQYKLEIMPTGSMEGSQFSPPLCKDFSSSNTIYDSYEPCLQEFRSSSAFDERFYNTQYSVNNGNLANLEPKNLFKSSRYSNLNDSSIYDVEPVKEIPVYHKKEGQNSYLEHNIKGAKTNNGIIVPFNSPNHNNSRIIKNQCSVSELAKLKSKMSCKLNPVVHTHSSYGLKNVKPKIKAALCSTSIAKPNIANNKTVPTCVRKRQSDKTRLTVNQIKVILDTVLSEVKETSQVKRSTTIQKKDAYLQVGSSQIYTASPLADQYSYSSCSMCACQSPCFRQAMTNQMLCYSCLTSPYPQMYHPLLVQSSNYINGYKGQLIQKCASTNTDTIENQESQQPTESSEAKELITSIFKPNDIQIKNEFNKVHSSKAQIRLVENHNGVKEYLKREPEENTTDKLPKIALKVNTKYVMKDASTSKTSVSTNVSSVMANVSKRSVKCGSGGDYRTPLRNEILTVSESSQWLDQRDSYNSESNLMAISNGSGVIYKMPKGNGVLNNMKKLLAKLFKTSKKNLLFVEGFRDSDEYDAIANKNCHPTYFTIQKCLKVKRNKEDEYKRFCYDSLRKNREIGLKRTSESVQLGIHPNDNKMRIN